MLGKYLGILCVGIGALLLTSHSAYATTFDFVQYAAGNEGAAVTQSFTVDGVTVTASARGLKGDPSPVLSVYLDDVDRDGPAGLGVCSGTNGGFCAENEDDNLQKSEVLMLTFDAPVEITDITFSNGKHLDDYVDANGHKAKFGVAIDPSSVPHSKNDFAQYLMAADFSGLLYGTFFSFISDETISGILGDEHQLYISSISVRATAVPEPMTAGLLSLGLLPALRRRRLAS